MMIFRRILAFAILTVLAIAFTAFYVRWERAGKIIKTSELSSQYEFFDKNSLTEAEVLIGEIVFGTNKDTAISFCPSFRRLRTQDPQGVGPSHHLARLIFSGQKPNRAIDFHIIDSHIDRLFLSCRLERDYAQETLLGYTLSKVYLGNGEYGVQKASASLFEKPIDQITDIEAFRIAALIKQPNLRSNSEAWERRTLALMEKSSSVD